MDKRNAWLGLGVMLAVSCGGDPTADPAYTAPGDLSFTWSPGGDSLLVVHHTDSTFDELVLVDRITGVRTHTGVNAVFPSWVAGRQDIVVTMAGGSALLRPSDWSVHPLPFPGLSPFAAWHPSAPLLVVTSNNAINTNPPDAWLADTLGGQFRRIPLSGPPRDQVSAASWSPVGDRLVAGVVGRLLVFDTTATDTAYITPTSQRASFPAWSPNGDWIAYQAHATSASEFTTGVYLVRPDGSERRKIFASASLPKWSPDGARVGFVRFADGTFSIWSVDTLGKGLRQETFPE